MKLKLAKNKLVGKTSEITIADIEKDLKKEEQKIYYFDQENAHKDLVALVDAFEDKDYSVYLREVKFGLDENSFMYEVHIL
jgi:ribosomal protein S3AE